MTQEQKYVYLITCPVDLGISVEAVYSNFHDIPFKMVPVKKYKWTGGICVENGYEEDIWESEERYGHQAKFVVYRYPVIGG